MIRGHNVDPYTGTCKGCGATYTAVFENEERCPAKVSKEDEKGHKFIHDMREADWVRGVAAVFDSYRIR